MLDAGQMRVMEILADATNVIAEGEVMQLMNMHDASLGEAGYLRVIRSKTAKLFEASARLGALLARADAATEQACASYGRALGTAFQLVDDLLDYDGDTHQLGKNVGDDLREGKPTLPLLVAMARGSDGERALIRHAIEQGEVTRLNDVVTAVRRTGALDVARDVARTEAQTARDCLARLAPSIYKDALLDLCLRSADRSS